MDTNFKQRLNMHAALLTRAEEKIGQFILEKQSDLKGVTISRLAEAIPVAPATITRFIQKLGYASFQDFKYELYASGQAEEEEDNFFPEINDDSTVSQLLDYTFVSSVQSLEQTQKSIDRESFQKAVKMISKCRSLNCFGTGTSSVLTYFLYNRFIRTSLEVFFASDLHIQLMQASKLNNQDLALIISHTGINKDILRVVDILKKNKVSIINITAMPKAPIAQQADLVLTTLSDETSYRPEAFSSIIAQACLIDSLFTAYAVKYEKNKNLFHTIRSVIKDTRLR